METLKTKGIHHLIDNSNTLYNLLLGPVGPLMNCVVLCVAQGGQEDHIHGSLDAAALGVDLDQCGWLSGRVGRQLALLVGCGAGGQRGGGGTGWVTPSVEELQVKHVASP